MIILAVSRDDPARPEIVSALEAHCRTNAYTALVVLTFTSGSTVLGYGYEIRTYSPEALEQAQAFIDAAPEVARYVTPPFVGWWNEVNRQLAAAGFRESLFGEVQRLHRAGWSPDQATDYMMGQIQQEGMRRA